MWANRLSYSSSKEPPQPVAEQHILNGHVSRGASAGTVLLQSWKQFVHVRYLQQCLHSWNGNLSVSGVAFWAGISLSMLGDLANHSAICVAFLKEHMGDFIIRKLLRAWELCVFASKNSDPFRALIGGIIFVSADQKLT